MKKLCSFSAKSLIDKLCVFCEKTMGFFLGGGGFGKMCVRSLHRSKNSTKMRGIKPKSCILSHNNKIVFSSDGKIRRVRCGMG